MLTFVSSVFVDGGFILIQFSVLETDVMWLFEVWSSTFLKIDGFAGGGVGGAMIWKLLTLDVYIYC